ncbi:ABC efflux pump, inner membrane subunit [Candidatus Sulfotelmatobacter sp. SbA7]|jgi:putative ABC transport system permease protein|nr:ABC efflux pump, inner membrane subunit [Candidatus Sulfotelmatobacter sp. SbA7]
MMNKMIVANLAHRPVRSLISIVAIALEVTLILLIVGLCLGLLSDSRQRQAGIGADVVVMPPGSSFIVGLTGSPMSIKVGSLLAKIPHVVTVAPVVQSVSTQGAIEVIAGIEPESYQKLSGPFRYLQGGPFQSPSDCLVDEIFARSHHVKAGDTIEILNNKFRVAGVVEPGKGARKFLEMGVMQDLIGAQGKATLFYLKLDNPANADQVVDDIKQAGMERYVVTSMAYYLSMMTTSNYPGVSKFIDFVIAISVIIGFIVIFQAMYTAVMERTREIGILKSLGASKFYIVNVILRETVLLAIAGIVLGVIFSLTVRAGIDRRSTLRVIVTGGWILKATAIAIVGAILGALYPAYKAAQKDPIDALAYE